MVYNTLVAAVDCTLVVVIGFYERGDVVPPRVKGDAVGEGGLRQAWVLLHRVKVRGGG